MLSRGQGTQEVSALSGVATDSGNNLCLTPALGNHISLYYFSYNPASAVEAAFRFGPAGPLFLRNNLTVGGAVIAKDLGTYRCIEGEIDEALYLNLSSAVSTVWNLFYREY